MTNNTTEKDCIRSAKNKKERMFAALNSSNDDIFEKNCRIIVTGLNKEGERIYLGEVDKHCFYDKNQYLGLFLINKVRFNG